jgi:hypothetical protein
MFLFATGARTQEFLPNPSAKHSSGEAAPQFRTDTIVTLNQEVAEQFDIHPNQGTGWKAQLEGKKTGRDGRAGSGPPLSCDDRRRSRVQHF